MFCSCYGASSIFLLSQSKPEKIALKHNKLVNSRKVMAYHLSLNGSAGGCFSAYAAKSSISPLTCTIFDPTFCGRFHSFNFAQICVLDSYRPTLPLSPYNVANRHKHANRGNSTTSSHISISVAIPEKKKIQYLPVLHLLSA